MNVSLAVSQLPDIRIRGSGSLKGIHMPEDRKCRWRLMNSQRLFPAAACARGQTI